MSVLLLQRIDFHLGGVRHGLDAGTRATTLVECLDDASKRWFRKRAGMAEDSCAVSVPQQAGTAATRATCAAWSSVVMSARACRTCDCSTDDLS